MFNVFTAFIVFLVIISFVTFYFMRKFIKDLADIYWLRKMEREEVCDKCGSSSSKSSLSNANDLVPKFNNEADFEYFRRGIDYAFTVTQMGLYKMFKEDLILDYDSIGEALSKTITGFVTDPKDMKKWNDEYLKYVKIKIEERKQEDLLNGNVGEGTGID